MEADLLEAIKEVDEGLITGAPRTLRALRTLRLLAASRRTWQQRIGNEQRGRRGGLRCAGRVAHSQGNQLLAPLVSLPPLQTTTARQPPQPLCPACAPCVAAALHRRRRLQGREAAADGGHAPAARGGGVGQGAHEALLPRCVRARSSAPCGAAGAWPRAQHASVPFRPCCEKHASSRGVGEVGGALGDQGLCDQRACVRARI